MLNAETLPFATKGMRPSAASLYRSLGLVLLIAAAVAPVASNMADSCSIADVRAGSCELRARQSGHIDTPGLLATEAITKGRRRGKAFIQVPSLKSVIHSGSETALREEGEELKGHEGVASIGSNAAGIGDDQDKTLVQPAYLPAMLQEESRASVIAGRRAVNNAQVKDSTTSEEDGKNSPWTTKPEALGDVPQQPGHLRLQAAEERPAKLSAVTFIQMGEARNTPATDGVGFIEEMGSATVASGSAAEAPSQLAFSTLRTTSGVAPTFFQVDEEPVAVAEATVNAAIAAAQAAMTEGTSTGELAVNLLLFVSATILLPLVFILCSIHFDRDLSDRCDSASRPTTTVTPVTLEVAKLAGPDTSFLIPLSHHTVSSTKVLSFEIPRRPDGPPLYATLSCLPEDGTWAKVELAEGPADEACAPHRSPLATCCLVECAGDVESRNVQGALVSWLSLLLNEKEEGAGCMCSGGLAMPESKEVCVSLYGVAERLMDVEGRELRVEVLYGTFAGLLNMGADGCCRLTRHGCVILDIEASFDARRIALHRQGELLAVAAPARSLDCSGRADEGEGDLLQVDVRLSTSKQECVLLLICMLAMVVFKPKAAGTGTNEDTSDGGD